MKITIIKPQNFTNLITMYVATCFTRDKTYPNTPTASLKSLSESKLPKFSGLSVAEFLGCRSF